MPVHGEIRHLVANRRLAIDTGIAPERVVLAEDGVVVDLIDGVARVSGKVECGYVFVDGSSVGDITETMLKDRRILGDEGFITVMVVMDSATGKLAAGPEIHARGFIEDDRVFDPLKPLLEEALTTALSDGNDDPYQLQQVIRRTTGRWVNQAHRRRPMIIPVVLEA
jgi:ribonuclease J